MATSRTGTAQWKRVRAQALRRAQRQGQIKCPHCKVELDYAEGRIGWFWNIVLSVCTGGLWLLVVLYKVINRKVERKVITA